MEVYYAGNQIYTAKKTVFLAGPTPRDGSKGWRPDAVDIFNWLDFEHAILVPEPKGGWEVGVDYSEQIDWERDAMERADIVMFWIPREVEKMPAFTTNIEFGYWLAKDPSKIKLGHPEEATHMDYIDYKCDQNDIWVAPSLKRLIIEVWSNIDD